MALTTKERTELRSEHVGQGYSWEYVDEWQPKTTLYLHAPKLNAQGDVVKAAGTKVENLPGSPDYVLGKARIGMLPYPPSSTCECRWCTINNARADLTPESKDDTEDKIAEGESVQCQDCGESMSALTKAGALSKLRVHTKAHTSEA